MPVIKLENVSKKYLVDQRRQTSENLRDVLTDGLTEMGRKFLRPLGIGSLSSGTVTNEEFWALSDITFSVEKGERVGIIGRNGAGKSTLLKLLSRITAPTKGKISIRGRIASLLEVGTGFHPELTGRENIYLNGAIMGMSRAEIGRKFDQIVDFAEVERFLDAPVKRYSSGMYVRLAFAVSAHLEPEILIVDEVLAVGDLQFQRKCLGKMDEVGKDGRTILFVSHQMDAVRRLCQRCLWVESGKIVKDDNAVETVAAYEQSVLQVDRCMDGVFVRTSAYPLQGPHVRRVVLSHGDRGCTSLFSFGECMTVRLELDNNSGHDIVNGYVVLQIRDESGRSVSSIDSLAEGFRFASGTCTVACTIGPLNLYMQRYFIEVGFGYSGSGRVDSWGDDIFFEVTSCDPHGTGRSLDKRSGVVHLPSEWAVDVFEGAIG